MTWPLRSVSVPRWASKIRASTGSPVGTKVVGEVGVIGVTWSVPPMRYTRSKTPERLVRTVIEKSRGPASLTKSPAPVAQKGFGTTIE